MSKPTITATDRLMSIRDKLRMLMAGGKSDDERRLLAELDIALGGMIFVRVHDNGGYLISHRASLCDAVNDDVDALADALKQISAGNARRIWIGGNGCPMREIECVP